MRASSLFGIGLASLSLNCSLEEAPNALSPDSVKIEDTSPKSFAVECEPHTNPEPAAFLGLNIDERGFYTPEQIAALHSKPYQLLRKEFEGEVARQLDLVVKVGGYCALPERHPQAQDSRLGDRLDELVRKRKALDLKGASVRWVAELGRAECQVQALSEDAPENMLPFVEDWNAWNAYSQGGLLTKVGLSGSPEENLFRRGQTAFQGFQKVSSDEDEQELVEAWRRSCSPLSNLGEPLRPEERVAFFSSDYLLRGAGAGKEAWTVREPDRFWRSYPPTITEENRECGWYYSCEAGDPMKRNPRHVLRPFLQIGE